MHTDRPVDRNDYIKTRKGKYNSEKGKDNEKEKGKKQRKGQR